ncbi:c-type cytochrome [Kordiimonas lipolytica]
MLSSAYRPWCLILLAFLALSHSAMAGQPEAEDSRGPALFQNCVRCHTIAKDAPHRYGPNLHGLMERDIASAPGFDYSQTLLDQAGRWDRKRLNAFIAKPHLALPGNKMPYSGLMNPHDRADLLDWLMLASSDPKLDESVDKPLGIYSRGAPERGRALSRPCQVCHNFRPEEGHKIGPNLFGVIGRKVAGAEGYDYSDQHLRRGGYWTPEALENFFLERKSFRQGTHRAFRTLKGPIDRANLIAWLATLKETPEVDSTDNKQPSQLGATTEDDRR